MRILCCILLAFATGCVSYPKILHEYDQAQNARNELLSELDKHHAQWGDIRKAGRRISRKYGKVIAMRAVLKAWEETVGAPADLACDPYFIRDQKSNRAIDLGWLVCYPERWQVNR
jgi:hypothetical protein